MVKMNLNKLTLILSLAAPTLAPGAPQPERPSSKIFSPLTLPSEVLAGQSKRNMVVEDTATAPAANCANFSGEWNGECRIDGQAGAPKKMDVLQLGCAGLYINGQMTPIGGATQNNVDGPTGAVASASPHAMHSTTHIFWNTSRTMLHFATTSFGHSIGAAVQVRTTATGETTWALEGDDTLVSELSFSSVFNSGDQSFPNSHSVSCRFSRAPTL